MTAHSLTAATSVARRVAQLGSSREDGLSRARLAKFFRMLRLGRVEAQLVPMPETADTAALNAAMRAAVDNTRW